MTILQFIVAMATSHVASLIVGHVLARLGHRKHDEVSRAILEHVEKHLTNGSH